jgi:hypothetical protein
MRKIRRTALEKRKNFYTHERLSGQPEIKCWDWVLGYLKSVSSAYISQRRIIWNTIMNIEYVMICKGGCGSHLKITYFPPNFLKNLRKPTKIIKTAGGRTKIRTGCLSSVRLHTVIVTQTCSEENSVLASWSSSVINFKIHFPYRRIWSRPINYLPGQNTFSPPIAYLTIFLQATGLRNVKLN